MKWKTTKFIKSRDNNNGFRLLFILWSGQFLVFASNLSMMRDMTGEWKLIFLIGAFFCIAGGFLLYRTLKAVGGMKRMIALDIVQVGKILMDNGIILIKMVGCKQAGCQSVETGTIFHQMAV